RIGDGLSQLGWRPPLRTATISQLANGVDGDPEPWRRASGRRPRDLPTFLASTPAGVQEVWFSRLWLLKPMILGVLSLFWLSSGLIGLTRLDAAIDVLASRGLQPGAAAATVVVGSILDILLGIGIAFRRTAV